MLQKAEVLMTEEAAEADEPEPISHREDYEYGDEEEEDEGTEQSDGRPKKVIVSVLNTEEC